jgi:hypothetical protein
MSFLSIANGNNNWGIIEGIREIGRAKTGLEKNKIELYTLKIDGKFLWQGKNIQTVLME